LAELLNPKPTGPSETARFFAWAALEFSQTLTTPKNRMVRLLVLYGHPKDPDAFDKYYREHHIPIARRMKGLKKWTVGKVQPGPPGTPSPYYYIADLYAENRAAFEELLASPEGQAAVADVPNYATGGVTFIYTDIEEII
jgi:uncharacterized protein (TIGR02118 family)